MNKIFKLFSFLFIANLFLFAPIPDNEKSDDESDYDDNEEVFQYIVSAIEEQNNDSENEYDSDYENISAIPQNRQKLNFNDNNHNLSE